VPADEDDAAYERHDIPYGRPFFACLAPAWLDHVALIRGYEPPSRRRGFAWCDLGCGQGVTPCVLAATHPAGVFHGIDLMPQHIDHARRLAVESAAANALFHEADFADDLRLPRFQYIVSHGVYAWVGPSVQAAFLRFVDRHLAPGGLVYVSYNAMPGWASEGPLQNLVRALAGTVRGDSARRFRAAARVVRAMTASKVPALTASFGAAKLEQDVGARLAYLVHEYLQRAWRPLYVTEVRASMASIGLVPVGSATFIENYDEYVLHAKARELLASITDVDVRELVRDYFIDQTFRRDVFVRRGRRLDERTARRRLLDSTFALTRPAALVKYVGRTPAGQLRFDNDAAHAVVAGLARGPRRLAEVAATSKLAQQDILANALVLCAAGALRPVEPHGASVHALNQTVLGRLGGHEELGCFGLSCGTALSLDRALMKLLRTKGNLERGGFAGWRDYLDVHAE
jgi:SAM-dependent methyltransferase